jgi:hypothetical protein
MSSEKSTKKKSTKKSSKKRNPPKSWKDLAPFSNFALELRIKAHTRNKDISNDDINNKWDQRKINKANRERVIIFQASNRVPRVLANIINEYEKSPTLKKSSKKYKKTYIRKGFYDTAYMNKNITNVDYVHKIYNNGDLTEKEKEYYFNLGNEKIWKTAKDRAQRDDALSYSYKINYGGAKKSKKKRKTKRKKTKRKTKRKKTKRKKTKRKTKKRTRKR